MGRSSRRGSGRDQRATGRVIAGGWDGAEERPLSGPSPSAELPAAGVPPTPAAAGPSPAPLRRRRWWLLGGIAALLALVLVLPQVLVGERSPETEARSFLQAILDADTDAVREHMVEPGEGVLDVALTDQVTLAAEERVDRFTIEETVVDGDAAQVTATLRLGSRSEETTLHLTRHREGILRRPVWELDPVELPVLRVAVPVSASAVIMNGIEVPLPQEVTSAQAFGLVEVHLAALPGTYRLSTPEGGAAVAPTSARSTIPPVLGPWLNSLVEVGYDLTDRGREELSTYLVDTALDECAHRTEPRPENCPLSAPDDVTAEGTWKILTPPQIKFTGGMSGFYGAYGHDGLAEYTVTAEDGTTTSHRVPIEEAAVVMLDRDGRFSGTWLESQEATVY